MSRATGRVTWATGSCRQSRTTSVLDRELAFVTVSPTHTAIGAPVRLAPDRRSAPLERRGGETVAEARQRRRVDVRHLGAATQRRSKVRSRLRTRLSRRTDRQAPGRVRRTGEDPGQGSAAQLTGEEGLHDRGRPFAALLNDDRTERERPPAEQDNDHGRPCRDECVHEISWAPASRSRNYRPPSRYRANWDGTG